MSEEVGTAIVTIIIGLPMLVILWGVAIMIIVEGWESIRKRRRLR